MVELGMSSDFDYIREIQKQDLPAIERVQRAAYPTEMHEDQLLFQRIIQAPQSIALAYQDEGEILGYILGYPVDKSRQKFEDGPIKSKSLDAMYLHDQCLHPQSRGKGLANTLLERFEKITLKNGFHLIIATAVLDALPYWQHQGYEFVSESQYLGTKSTRIEKYL
jgi:ribosomal protein S18 acetylase RimI-like enzyme